MDLNIDKYNPILKKDDFIKRNFNIRTCYKYCAVKSDLCKCNYPRIDHEEEENQEKWSYLNNTRLEECTSYGTIKFQVCDKLCSDHKFIRFNVIEDPSVDNTSLSTIVDSVYTLMDVYWKIPKPKLVISVIGGFKRMDLSHQQKKNFKQGLIEIMKKDRTIIIAGGFNVGVHKLVSETVQEYRIYYESEETRVHLIGICTWGVVWKNKLLEQKYKGTNKNLYQSRISNEKGKVALDHNYDGFLFCDDGTERTYDIEVDFRSMFERYIEKKSDSFAVQILCEGGYRAVYRAHKTLENKISIVVLKGSGRAADIISDVLELKNMNLERNIMDILAEYKTQLNVQETDMASLCECLKDMYEIFSEQIVIYDMFDPTMQFGKMIVKAIISGQTKRSLEDTLKLTISFNCMDIAQTEVFSNTNYSKMDGNFIKDCFIKVLKKNKFEFVIGFLENGLDISNVLTGEVLITLYKESLDRKKCPYADLLSDLLSNKNIQTNELSFIGKIIPILSGHILLNYYSRNHKTESFKIQDLFLWALFSGRIELAEIFWKFDKDHISSALIGATILKNMSCYILKRGDSELANKLSISSMNFEKLAINILTKAYSESREKTFTILIRELRTWNKMNCLQIALNGNLLDFLSHSACRSYTTQVWMGGLSPFLSLWKILISIPFSLFCMHLLIIPSFTKRKSKRVSKSRCIQDLEDQVSSLKDSFHQDNLITFSRATTIFYTAPIVKFYLNFASYILFLVIFAYMNLIELKPRKEIKKNSDVAAETFIYVYLLTFIIEEIRQIKDQNKNDFQKKFKAYLSGSCNKLDVLIIFVFIISTIIRFILPENLFMICRCMFSVCYCMFCLRTMQFYFAYEFVGPKVIMIYDMIRDIIFFLSIFGLFIVSFGTLSHSMRFPNSEMNIYILKDIFYMPYFQTYGELMLDKLFDENICNTTNCQFERTTVALGFGVYLLFTNILLVNLLIAMFGYTFNKIQEQSEKHWLFIRLQLVEEFYNKLILPPPFNVLYYLYKVLIHFNKIRNCKLRKPTKCKYKDDLQMNVSFDNGEEMPEDSEQKSYDDLQNGIKVTTYNNDDFVLLKILSHVEYLRISGFEQICMEASMDFMQCNQYRVAAYSDIKKEYLHEEMRLLIQNSFGAETQETTNKLLKLSYDKRLKKIENNIENLIKTKKLIPEHL